MSNLWNREPVMVMALIQSALALVISFGVGLTVEQVGSIMAFSAALVGFITRTQVSPGGKDQL